MWNPAHSVESRNEDTLAAREPLGARNRDRASDPGSGQTYAGAEQSENQSLLEQQATPGQAGADIQTGN